MSILPHGRAGRLSALLTPQPPVGCPTDSDDADLAAAHAEIASMTPTELADLLLQSTAGLERDEATVRARLAAVRLAAIVSGVAA
jgi:hypothetical protein